MKNWVMMKDRTDNEHEEQGHVANPRPVAKIKTGRVAQPITDAADATGLGLQRVPGGSLLPQLVTYRLVFVQPDRFTVDQRSNHAVLAT